MNKTRKYPGVASVRVGARQRIYFTYYCHYNFFLFRDIVQNRQRHTARQKYISENVKENPVAYLVHLNDLFIKIDEGV